MTPQIRAAALAREVRSLLRVVRSIPARLADSRREQARSEQQRQSKPLFLESALAAAKSMRAPIVSP